MSVMTDSLKKGDHAIFYVSPFSKIGKNSKYVGDFLECYILGLMKDLTGDQDDDRVFVRCSKNLDKPSNCSNYMSADEALISVDSPFIMTWDEYKGCRHDPDYLDNWLGIIGDAICYDEKLCDKHYPGEIISNLSQAFHTEHREAIRFPE